MSKGDVEKGLTLPDLGDVYGGVEDNGPGQGIAEQSEPIAHSAPPPKAGTSSSSWFTTKRIIIIAVVAVVVVGAAVGGGVGGALGSKKSSPSSSDNQNPGGTTSSPPASATSGGNPAATGATKTANTIVPSVSATGTIIPSGMTAVAFAGQPTPTAFTPLTFSSDFPGIGSNVALSSENIVTNGDFTNNITNWENTDGCWGVENWDGKYDAAWNGAHPSAKLCNLAQSMDRKANAGKDTDYVVSFLYRNSVDQVTTSAWLWAYIGDEDTVSMVLATNEKKTTATSNWGMAAYKYTVKANKKARIVFRGFNDDGYWEVSMVQVAPLSAISGSG
ncbi:hypothetical protein TWF694_006224 [Orbilia ellipsospora]|uniref:Uncharacterized protein n=1 Tax=Orbilia ellipsospora TaxID=2528407 RepID=A0AAV9XM27_9PEZI